MNIRKTIYVILFSLFANASYADKSGGAFEASNLVLGETLTLQSSELNEPRTLNVYLPASYNEANAQDYPVIYLLDGSIDEDFIHITGVVQFSSFSWLNFMPESIVVGIANVDRKRDFSFASSDALDQKEFPTSGGSEAFIQFVKTEVQPLINKRYKASGLDTLIGQSLGGLLASQILIESPEMFDNYIIISPSLWWDKESLLAKEVNTDQQNLNVYVGVGAEGTSMVRLATSLADKLTRAYKGKNVVNFGYFEKLNHGDTLHLAAYDALKTVFAKADEDAK